MKKIIALLTAFSMIVSSCTTFKRDPQQEVTIISNPPGAQITIDGRRSGETPSTYSLSAKKSHLIFLEKDGYIPQSYLLDSKISFTRLSSNVLYPLKGIAAGIGAGYILSIVAGGSDIGVIGTICTAMGLLAGIATGAAGIGYNLCTGNAKRLVTTEVNLELQPEK